MSEKTIKSCVWFALVDTERCRLLQGDRSELGGQYFREVSVFENWWPEHRRRGLGGMTRTSYGSRHDYAGERVRHFAIDVIDRLEAECRERLVERMTIVATPRLTGELRGLCHSRNGLFELRESELTKFSTAVLADHRLIEILIAEPEVE